MVSGKSLWERQGGVNSRNVNKVVYRLKRWSVEGREVLWTASGSWLG